MTRRIDAKALPESAPGHSAAERPSVPTLAWVPLVPAALMLGVSVASLAIAMRASGRLKALEQERALVTAHERLHHQDLETISP